MQREFNPNPRLFWASWIALFVTTFLLYVPILHGHFLYDDVWYIVRNPFMHSHFSLLSLFSDLRTTAHPASGLSTDVYRPLTTGWFWLDAHLWRANTFPYHVENVLLHLTNGALLFTLLRPWTQDNKAVWVGVAVFLLHPVQVQSVAWITQRSTLASTTFLLVSLYLITKASSNDWLRWMGGMLCACLALLFRETSVVLPLLFFAIGGLDERNWWNKRNFMGLIALCVLYLGVRYAVLHQWSQLSDISQSWVENFALGVLAFPVYLGKMILPLKLRISYGYPSIHLISLLFAAIVWIIYLTVGWIILRYDRWISAGMAWILFGLLPVLQIIPIRAFVAERFLYIPVIGLALIATRVSLTLFGRWLCLIWILFLMGMTWRAVPTWQSDERLWAEAVRQEPGNAFAHICYGTTLKDPNAAATQFYQALKSHPNKDMHFAAVNNLANVYLLQGKYIDALRWSQEAVKEEPTSPEALYNLGMALVHTGQRKEAIRVTDQLRQLLGPTAGPVMSLQNEIKKLPQ